MQFKEARRSVLEPHIGKGSGHGGALGRNTPTVLPVISLRPPAIQNAEMRHAIDAGLHAGGTARL